MAYYSLTRQRKQCRDELQVRHVTFSFIISMFNDRY